MASGPDLLKALVGVHVLIVDADAGARELLESVLTYCGAFVTSTGDAREALRSFHARPADVVIADVTLPEHDAYWLVQQIGARAPVIALTIGGREGPDRTLDAGFHGHLRKPVDPWELCRVVAELARKA